MTIEQKLNNIALAAALVGVLGVAGCAGGCALTDRANTRSDLRARLYEDTQKLKQYCSEVAPRTPVLQATSNELAEAGYILPALEEFKLKRAESYSAATNLMAQYERAIGEIEKTPEFSSYNSRLNRNAGIPAVVAIGSFVVAALASALEHLLSKKRKSK